MPLYSLDDFKPAPDKINRRVGLVLRAARVASKVYAHLAKRDYGVVDAIRINEVYLEEYVKSYFHRVAAFKLHHDFTPDERINQPKIAALMLKTLSKERWQNFFERHDARLSDDFMEKLFYEFCYQLMCLILFISDGLIPNDLLRDFYICMHQDDFMSDEWSCWMMAFVLRAYGQEDPGLQE